MESNTNDQTTTNQPSCRVCGSPFVRYAPNQRACSPTCSHELARLRRARCKPEHLKAPRQAISCAHCGETFTPKRSTERFCSRPCRIDHHRGIPFTTEAQMAEIMAEHQRAADSAIASLLRRRSTWARSDHAKVLLAADLPGNFTVAAALLGISVDTLRQRVWRGIPLFQPLRCDRRCGRPEPLPLTVPDGDVAQQFEIRQTNWQRKLAEFHQSLQTDNETVNAK